jgi:UDP-N-acetylglucosamine--N-acetylmuramyl-(pentapeptide) pyrophosphoryl-undecaprenol N-acetylglucosamine transferase
MKIVLTGGGSGGPVAPLLAMAEEIKSSFAEATKDEGKKPEAKFLFIGTRRGIPEKEMVKDYNIEYKSVYAGKLRRYFSWQNFLDIARTKIGFFQTFYILKKFKPDLIIGAGGYVSVPVILAGWFLRIPSFIQQQDILPTLSNKILAIFAKKIFVSFEPSLICFPGKKTFLSGHPVRRMFFKGDKEKAKKLFNLETNKPVLVVLGGGTGAISLNNLIWNNLKELTNFCQVVHLAGRGKILDPKFQIKNMDNYHVVEFLTNEIADLFTLADMVISRAGINVLAELAVLAKPTIVIPIPDSHQEANAQYFQDKNAAIVLNQKELTGEKLVSEIKELLNNKEKQNQLGGNIIKLVPQEAAKKIVNEIIKLVIR